MSDPAEAVASRAREYLAAAVRSDAVAMCSYFSSAAAAVALVAARADGAAVGTCEAAMAHLLERGIYPRPPGTGDFHLGAVTVDGELAAVTVTARPVEESATLPFVFEGGAWKVGVAGVHDLNP
jgi:hypothetical protein